MSFTSEEYAVIREGCIRSAQAVAPLVYRHVQPQRVLDIGCGEGHWLSAFAAQGSSVIVGVDGHEGSIPGGEYHQVNLEHDQIDLGQFDLAVSLEVAEHLTARRADWLVERLTRHAPTVLFSAAIPNQGGYGHINEQWPQYWAERFNAFGFEVTGALRWIIWDDPEVEPWYCQNLLLCTSDINLYEGPLFDGPGNAPIGVVHPRLWASRV